MYCLSSTGVCFSSPAHTVRTLAVPDASCRRGTYFFTYGLPVASSRCLAIVRKRPLASVRCSVPPGASAIRASPMALGCCVGCATKKVSKKVAGNAIPRSRLPSDRKIAHSRVSSLYPLNEWEKRYLTVRFLLMRFDRIAGFCAQAALRLQGVGAKPNGESILTLRLYFIRVGRPGGLG